MSETRELALEKVTDYLKGSISADGFLAAVEELKRAQAQIAQTGKQALAELSKALFLSVPEVLSIQWAQYTPYFNDGDACVFGLRRFGAALNAETVEAWKSQGWEPSAEYEDGSREYFDSWTISSEYYWGKKTNKEAMVPAIPERALAVKDAVGSFEQALGSIEDILESTFGDHVKVTINADGTIETEEYNHD